MSNAEKTISREDYDKKIEELNALLAGSSKSMQQVNPEIGIDELADTLSKLIKHDWENKLITFLAMLLAFTHDSQLNISFNAPSAVGKTYITKSLAQLFPVDDRIELNTASPKALFYKEGVLDEATGANIVELSRKILIFYEVPTPELQKTLRSIMSHDSWDNRYLSTNKDKKGANRAEEVIMRGYPSIIFCSAGLRLDAQEATRSILLSPEETGEKLAESLRFTALRNSGDTNFLNELANDPELKKLRRRIEDIKAAEVDHVYIPDYEAVYERFRGILGQLKARHNRDLEHFFNLIKGIALLNLWHRRDDQGRVVANRRDIDQAFRLWEKIADSQDHNVSPVLMDFYRDVIIPAYQKKLADPQYAGDMKAGLIGLEQAEVTKAYYQQTAQALNWEYWRNQMRSQLEASGLIRVDRPQALYSDKRSLHIFPLLLNI